jgi:predicted transcriptional regulator
MRVIYQKRDLKRETVGDHMTTEVTTGQLEDGIELVMDRMTHGRYRHMPVVENNKLVGLVSIGDTVKAKLDHDNHQVIQLREYLGGPVPN